MEKPTLFGRDVAGGLDTHAQSAERRRVIPELQVDVYLAPEPSSGASTDMVRAHNLKSPQGGSSLQIHSQSPPKGLSPIGGMGRDTTDTPLSRYALTARRLGGRPCALLALWNDGFPSRLRRSGTS